MSIWNALSWSFSYISYLSRTMSLVYVRYCLFFFCRFSAFFHEYSSHSRISCWDNFASTINILSKFLAHSSWKDLHQSLMFREGLIIQPKYSVLSLWKLETSVSVHLWTWKENIVQQKGSVVVNIFFISNLLFSSVLQSLSMRGIYRVCAFTFTNFFISDMGL